jgi:hypothetical protein
MTYVEQKLADKQKQLEKLENQLFDMHHRVDLLKAEIAAYADVLEHGKSEPPDRPPKKDRPAKSRPPARAKSDDAMATGHWPAIIAKLSRSGRFTVDDIMRELTAIKRPNRRPSVRAKLADLVDKGRLTRVANGVFELAPQGVSGDQLRAMGIIPPHARVVGEK